MSTKQKFNRGDEVFDADGKAYEYIAAVQGQHCCLPIYIQYDEHYVDPLPVMLNAVYASSDEAVAKTSAEVAALHEKATELRREISNLNLQRRQEDAEVIARRERIKQHEKLKLLDDYLAGKITHFVVRPGLDSPNISVKTTQQATTRPGEYGRTETKLLTLYGDSKGDLQFKFSYYSEGSGSQELVYPFTNEQEAIEFAKKEIASGLIGCMNGNKNGAGVPWALKEWINTADSFGVPVPDNMREIQSNFERKCLDERIEKARAELDRLLSLQEGGAA